LNKLRELKELQERSKIGVLKAKKEMKRNHKKYNLKGIVVLLVYLYLLEHSLYLIMILHQTIKIHLLLPKILV
jgi:hypothetical protein